jgi:hypothetical protein
MTLRYELMRAATQALPAASPHSRLLRDQVVRTTTTAHVPWCVVRTAALAYVSRRVIGAPALAHVTWCIISAPTLARVSCCVICTATLARVGIVAAAAFAGAA